MDASHETASVSRRRALRTLPLPLAAAALVGGLTALAAPDREPGYDARSAVHISQKTAADPVSRVTRIVPSEVLDTVSSPELRKAVAKKLKLPDLAADDVTVEPRTETNGDVLDITATATTSAAADKLASTYASLAAARLQAESSQRVKAAIALLDQQQASLAAQQSALAKRVAGLPTTNPLRNAADEQLATLSRQRTQNTSDRNVLITTSALLGPAARAAGTLEVTKGHGVSPRLLRGGLAGSGAGLLVALVVLGASALRRRVPSLEPGETLNSLPVLGVVPRRASDGGCASQAECDAVDGVVGEVLLEQRRTGCAVLGVTAPGRLSGTSATAASLAAGLARRGLKVLLVDADIRNPSQHALHGLPLAPGLADRLRGGAVKPGLTADGVHVLPSGFSAAPADLLGHQSLVALLQKARSDHDAVVVDVGTLEHPESRLVAALTDRVLLCAVPGRTSQDALETCLTILRSGTLLGLVLVRTGAVQRRTDGAADVVRAPQHPAPGPAQPPKRKPSRSQPPVTQPVADLRRGPVVTSPETGGRS
jgi:Mrp family chromosome partitioning ATPase/capsular polysaccharide biosynthesis protein